MSAEDRTRAMNYEFLITKALNCERDKKGASLDYFQNLIVAERGESPSYLKNYEKQLEEVKKYISKALLKLSNNKLYVKELDFFNLLDEQLQSAKTTSELEKIINSTLNKINE